MHTYTPLNQKQKKKAVVFAVLGLIIVLGASLFLIVRPKVSKPTKPTDFTKVSAVTGNTISLSIKTDASGPYFEFNGEKLSMSNMLEGVKTNTEYTIEIANTTSTKQGLFLPTQQLNILVNPGQSDNKNRITFRYPGTFVFLPAAYYPGWEQMKSGFIVQSDSTLDPNTCQCDLWAVVEQNCISPNQPVCTNKFGCACTSPQ